MVKFTAVTASLAALTLAGSVVAHPGEKLSVAQRKREVAKYQTAQVNARRGLSACADSAVAQAMRARAVSRRAVKAQALRQKRGVGADKLIRKRQGPPPPGGGVSDPEDYAKYAATSHNETTLGYTLDTPAETIFATNATCALAPEAVGGPYYVIGEYIREDITEGEPGVAMHLDLQFVDINTCEPIPALLVDYWQCNSTGTYSGVVGGTDSTGRYADQGGLNSTFLRGVQATDSDGVIQFDSIFPGHYTGRATHAHVMAVENATVLANQTYTGGIAHHIGQFFFDQDLISIVEALSPYTANEQVLTTNAEDDIAPATASAEYDPFLDYVYLGDSVEDGLLVYGTVGINMTATQDVQAAAHYYSGGGVSL